MTEVPDLPVARPDRADEGVQYRLAVVCLGNICRSPMAHVVLEAALAEAGLDDRVEVTSSGTGGWHVGQPMDPRAAATLERAGLDPSHHRAEQFTASWFSRQDLVLAMDATNLADLRELADQTPDEVPPGRLRLFRDFDPDADGGPGETTGRDVPDPYYGGDHGFADVLTLVKRTSDALVERLVSLLGRP